jgi:hypothetical protein
LCGECDEKIFDTEDESGCLHSFEDNICKICGDVEVDETVCKCEGCGEEILENDAVVKGENRHAVCS